MFENDYLMKMILELVASIQRALRDTRQQENESTVEELEAAIGSAVDIDPQLFFSLAPESLVSVLQLGNFDPVLCEYVVRSIFFEADLLEKNGQTERADLRRSQAGAIAKAYGSETTAEDARPEALEAFFEEASKPPSL